MTDEKPIRVFAVDDHPLLRQGIAALIESQRDMVLVGQAATGAEAVEQFGSHQPDVTLMDLRLPDIGGIDAIVAIKADFPNAAIIVLTTAQGDAEAKRALDAGARGYLLKTMPPHDLLEGIRQVHAGGRRIPTEIAALLAEHMGDETLTEREFEVLRQVAAGSRNREIAENLLISELTVKAHIRHILDKLGAVDRTAAVATAVRRGILQL
ncbi:MAG TPA: response regulator transcription factor [Blastocatellia bacterium]|nr:response regulator transcription factor [Blastocatellia bacterium]